MIFLSLLMDLMLMFGGAVTNGATLDNGVNQSAHTVHGHLPGGGNGHNGTSHLHHGQHGHTTPTGGGHEIFHPGAGTPT